MAKMRLTFDRVKVNPEAFDGKVFQQFAEGELAFTVGNVIERNLQGKDADGAPLKAYQPSYEQAIRAAKANPKVSRGKNKGKTKKLAKKDGNTTSNLHLEGNLHDSYGPAKVRAIPNGAEVVVPPDQAGKFRGLLKHGFKNFFAIGKQDEERTARNWAKLVAEQAKKLITVTKSS